MKQTLIEWVKIVVPAVIIAFILGNYILINTVIPTGSMSDTIKPGSRLIGSRLAYKSSDPKRGDIVIFKYPVFEYLVPKLKETEEGRKFMKDNKIKKMNYIKRVIGLPGETVEIQDGKIYINGTDNPPLEETYLKEEWKVKSTGIRFDVPEDCYLVLGDNRNDSEDSRYWTDETRLWLQDAGLEVNEDEIKNLCFINKRDIVGKAIFQYWKGFKKLS